MIILELKLLACNNVNPLTEIENYFILDNTYFHWHVFDCGQGLFPLAWEYM